MNPHLTHAPGKCKKCLGNMPIPRPKNQIYCSQRCAKRARRKKDDARKLADPKRRIRVRLNQSLRNYMRISSATKRNSILKYLGCSPAELAAHLERQFRPGMTWANYGRRGWHVDHIIPCSAFNLSREDHIHVCYHHSNLQPLWCTDNEQKNSTLVNYIPQELKDKAFAVGILVL